MSALNPAKMAAYERGYRVLFNKRLAGETPAFHKVLAMETQSTNTSEDYGWLGDLVGLTRKEGAALISNAIANSYNIKNETWTATIGMDVDKFKDDNYGFYDNLVSEEAENARDHYDELLGIMLSRSFNSAYPDYTGKAFFDSNKEFFSGSAKFTNKGTAVLSRDNYRAARQAMLDRTNGRGRPMRLGRQIVLVVSSKNEPLAREIVEVGRTANGADNVDKTATVLHVPDLAAAGMENAWFLFETGRSVKPFILQIREKPYPRMATNEQDGYVIANDQFLWQVKARHNIGFGLSQLAWGSTGAG